MSELVDKQVNVQREFEKTSGIHPKLPQAHAKLPQAHAKLPQAHEKVCDENERNKETNKEKNDGRLKYFLMEEGVYKARAEYSCHGYQTTSDQRFFIH